MDYRDLITLAFREGGRDAQRGAPLDDWQRSTFAVLFADADVSRDCFVAWRAGWYAQKKTEACNV